MYLVPNSKIGKKGLRNGEISSKKDEYLKLTDTEIKVLEKNIPGLKSRGIIVDVIPEVVEKVETKSDKRMALEKEAVKLEIDFTDRTSGKELAALIEEKLK